MNQIRESNIYFSDGKLSLRYLLDNNDKCQKFELWYNNGLNVISIIIHTQ
jgi:hypothetical protein